MKNILDIADELINNYVISIIFNVLSLTKLNFIDHAKKKGYFIMVYKFKFDGKIVKFLQFILCFLYIRIGVYCVPTSILLCLFKKDHNFMCNS